MNKPSSVIMGFAALLAVMVSHASAQVPAESPMKLTRIIAGKKITVTAETLRVNKGTPGFPRIEEATDHVAILKEITINVDGASVFVPRSVYADLLDPRDLSLHYEKPYFVLEIVGADGAEAYKMRAFFNSTAVKRRLIYSLLTPDEISEDTRYRQTTLKDVR